MLKDVSLQMLENSYADIHLIIGAKENTSSNIVAYFNPVQVIPKTLSYPLQANLKEKKRGGGSSFKRNKRQHLHIKK